MNQRLVLIKFGGSFITDKTQPYHAETENIAKVAKQFAASWQAHKDTTDFVLGTGAGSYGHVPAHQYGLRDGAKTPEQFYGLAVTHNSVVKLNNLVATALTDESVPAFSASPGTIMSYHDGERQESYFENITQLVKAGCVPMLHGDGAPDAVRGSVIISTEQALQAYLEVCHADYAQVVVVYLMNTHGVLDADGNTLIELAADQAVTVLEQKGHDVTGSITSKVTHARKAAQLADSVYLVSGHDDTGLQNILAGKSAGTHVLA